MKTSMATKSTSQISTLVGKKEKITIILINMFVVALVSLTAYLAWMKINKPNTISSATLNPIEEESAPDQENIAANIPYILSPSMEVDAQPVGGVFRKATLLTIIPKRPRTEVITYTVKTGDTLFSIAEKYKIKPSTLLWGNFDTLEDNPHFLKPNQVLNILPVDGTYYEWLEGDNLKKVADFFQADPGEIAAFAGNHIDLTLINAENSGIDPGTWIIIPNGKRAIKDWGPPAISRNNPAVATRYGPGACSAVYEGAVGTGSFLWPTTERQVSGFRYDAAIHPAIDIAGQIGNAVYASDSGVVVYAGWSDYGYGYLIVIDHGFGWQTAYAHLSSVGVSCGQSVFRGGLIGGLGSTGNSTGAHLHFELVYNGAKLNPLDFLQ